MIKAVIFDIDGTLYDYESANAKAFAALSDYAAENLGTAPEDFREAHDRTMRELREYMGDVAAVHNRTIRYQVLLERLGLPLHPHVLRMGRLYWDTLIDAAVPSAHVRETFQILKERGIRIGVGTDMTARTQFRKLTALGLLSEVDFLVSSEEAGAEKPEPAFFARCVQKANCRAEECLFVGDSLRKDVQGALSAGLRAVWYRAGNRQAQADVLQITDMGQLPQLVTEQQQTGIKGVVVV